MLKAAANSAVRDIVPLVPPVPHGREASLQSNTQAELTGRAATVECNGGVPREWPEGVARLCDMPRPVAVPEKAWRRFIDDCGRFLAGGWAERAARLGWRSLELFGCHQEAPLARYDRQGLLWLIDGRQVIALTAETAVMESCSGARLTYRRKPIHGEAVLAWDLSP